MTNTVKLYPKKVFGTVANAMAGNHLADGWVCEHADFAEPKKDGEMVLCLDCFDDYSLGAKIEKLESVPSTTLPSSPPQPHLF
jgi:hypothetical protein